MFWLPIAMWSFFVFIIGLMIGSFLNVVVARLPYEKSVIWPGSHCGSCLRALKWYDNVPILGWLRLRGRCRFCAAQFSSRYLWVELFTGLAILGLFFFEILAPMRCLPPHQNFLTPWLHTPGLEFVYTGEFNELPRSSLIYFCLHAALLSFLIAAALVDAEHKIIPLQITYLGTFVGLLGSTFCPWPWPSDNQSIVGIPAVAMNLHERLPTGMTLWPFWWPLESWFPASGSVQGLLNGVIGAAVGTALVRVIKHSFEVGMKREALGLGDADLMMMAGAFLGWQVALIGFFLGGVAGLLLKIPTMIFDMVRGKEVMSELPFGPGLCLGILATWFGWPVVSTFAMMLYEPEVVVVIVAAIGIGMFLGGIIMHRETPKAEGTKVA